MSRMTRNSRGLVSLDADGWIVPPRGTMYRYHIYVTGQGGNYTATAATVPGVTATGESIDVALANIHETLASLLRETKAAGQPMPRGDVTPPPGAVLRGVFIDLGPA